MIVSPLRLLSRLLLSSSSSSSSSSSPSTARMSSNIVFRYGSLLITRNLIFDASNTPWGVEWNVRESLPSVSVFTFTLSSRISSTYLEDLFQACTGYPLSTKHRATAVSIAPKPIKPILFDD